MSHRERGDPRNQVPVPEGCDRMDKELRTLSWIQDSISATHRLPSSKRKETLVNALTAMLEDPHLETMETLYGRLETAKSVQKDLSNQMELLKARLDKYQDESPIVFSILDRYPKLTDVDGNLRYRLITNAGYRKWTIVTVITVILSALFLITKFLQ